MHDSSESAGGNLFETKKDCSRESYSYEDEMRKKTCVKISRSRLLPNDGLDYLLTLPDSLMMYQQTRYYGPTAKLKMVSGHHSTGSEHEVDLALPGFTRSTGTREYLPVTDAVELAAGRSFW